MPRKKFTPLIDPTTKEHESLEKLRKVHPHLMDVMIKAAQTKNYPVKCPACDFNFSIDLGANERLLIHLDNRHLGKPLQPTDIDIHQHHTLELSNEQQQAIIQGIMPRLIEVLEINVEKYEDKIKKLPMPITEAEAESAEIVDVEPVRTPDEVEFADGMAPPPGEEPKIPEKAVDAMEIAILSANPFRENEEAKDVEVTRY